MKIKEEKRLQLAVSNIAWSKLDDIKVYELLSNLGFHGLEIAPPRTFSTPFTEVAHDELIAFKDSLVPYNLELVSMQSITYGFKDLNIFQGVKNREGFITHLKSVIDLAKSLNIKSIVFGCPKNRVFSEISEEEIKEIGVSFFSSIGKYAASNGVQVQIEANPEIYGTNFINTTMEAFKWVEELNNSGIGLNFDLGALIANKEKVSILTKIISRIGHVHISEPFLAPISQTQHEEVHFELAECLKSNGYKGWVSLEMKDCQNLEEFEKSLQFVKKVYS